MGTTPYDVITDRMVAKLSEGTVPWRKPWNATTDAPRNLDGKLYRGINVWMLMGGASPIWMTFNAAREHGGSVRKGERSTPVVFWKVDKYTAEDDDGKTVIRKRFILRYYNVFNLTQTDGVKVPAKTLAGVTPNTRTVDPIDAAEAIITGMPNRPALFWDERKAYYRPSLDEVHLPPRNTFESPDKVYSTAFHELGHSTGHQSRLNRAGVTDAHSFGSDMYGREELVAEMTSAFLCGESGIIPETLDNSAAYIASWIGTIKADTKALVVAAGQAQKAADFILNRQAAVVEEAPVTEGENA